MRWIPFILLVLGTSCRAETPEQIAAELSIDHPHVADLLAAHPEILKVWQEDFWADALLRSPKLPGTQWRSHDMRRPQPPKVTPAFKNCPALPAPANATVLLSSDVFTFEGDLDQWALSNGELTPKSKISNRLKTKQSFGDMQLHLEVKMPSEEPHGAFQYRGNSGIFLMERYEVQLLDSWNNPVYPDGMLGALYGQKPPLVNASLPPGRWQCIDIVFTAPRFEGESLASPATLTMLINGIAVQKNAAFLGPTAFGHLPPHEAHPAELPFSLQDHGDGTSKVTFRNIWVRDLKEAP